MVFVKNLEKYAKILITYQFNLRHGFLVLYWDCGICKSIFCIGIFPTTGCVEEGAYRDQVQVNPVVRVLFSSR